MGDPSQDTLLPAGRVFGHYQVVRHLGTGGMGSVYESTHVELGKRVALKTLLPLYAANAEARARFLREGKLAAKLHHPHVVDVTDCGIQEGTPYLVMELLEGEDLASLLEREGKLFPEQIAEVMVPIVAALAAAHDQDIVHRDLKPENIFLARVGGETVPKVLDFGISKALSDTADARQLTGSLSLVGTPAYMAPEQVRSSKQLDDRCDQYAMGVILYQCATGRLPFWAEAVFELLRLVADGRYARPSSLVPGLPAAFEQVITTAMAMSPADRFEDTREFGAALLPFASARTQMVWGRDFESRADTVITAARARPVTGPPMPAVTPLPPEPITEPPEPITDPGLAPARAAARAPPPSPRVILSESSARIENPRSLEQSDSDPATQQDRRRPRPRSGEETVLESASAPREEISQTPTDRPAPRPMPLKLGVGAAALAGLLMVGMMVVSHRPVGVSVAPTPTPEATAPVAPVPAASHPAPIAADLGSIRVVVKGHTPTTEEVALEIDGVGTRGRAPLELTFPVGKHVARVTHGGQSQEMAVDLKKGETVILMAP